MIFKRCTLLIAIIATVTACQRETPTPETAPLRPVRTITVAATGNEQITTFNGEAVASKESSLSFKVSGTVESILVSVGEQVTKGQPLAKMDTTDFNVEHRSSIANLKNAEANGMSADTRVNTSRSNYVRAEKLYESSSVALSEFEQAKGDFETALAQKQAAEAQISTARSQVQAAKNKLDYTTLTAPYDGVINRVLLEENEVIKSGTVFLTISNMDNTEIEVNLSDLYITYVKPKKVVTVHIPTLAGKVFSGKVSEISYAASDDATYPVVIRLDGSSPLIRPGMAANVTFNFYDTRKPGEKLIYLPASAIGEDTGGNFVFVIEKAGEGKGLVRRRSVTLGELTPNGFAVQSGVSIGELVATSGLQVLLENMAVKL